MAELFLAVFLETAVKIAALTEYPLHYTLPRLVSLEEKRNVLRIMHCRVHAACVWSKAKERNVIHSYRKEHGTVTGKLQ